MQTGAAGYWINALGGPPRRRDPISESVDADIAIVGGGYTGLWTAYYLKLRDPSLRVVVVEADFCGAGASGRNGGWVTGYFSGPRRVYERRGGRDGIIALQREMFATVDEIGRVIAAEGIDASWLKPGHLAVALNPAQVTRLRGQVEYERSYGFDEDDMRMLDTGELADRVRVGSALGGAWTPHVARIDPAALVFGLADVVERLGVVIYEGSPVSEIRSGAAVTASGIVRADWVIRATEGYTARLHGLKRKLVPMNSSAIVTEPLPQAVWDEIGWRDSELMSDCANAYVYLQRTPDGGISIGGRGRPYRYGSRTNSVSDIPERTISSLRNKFDRMFPAAAGVPLAYAWSGVIGVPRDWCMSVSADNSQRIAWAGGYVGQGVAATNLAGRTLTDLVIGTESELTKLPWVGRSPREWEPEPLRWPMIHSVYALYRFADRIEARSGRTAKLAAVVDHLSGRH